MRFDIFQSKNAQSGEVCTLERFREAIDSERVVKLCRDIAGYVGQHEDQNRLKVQLPCITPMATFGGKGHKKVNARPSGLYMLDIDSIDDPEACWMHIQEKNSVDFLQVVLAHKTPSLHGLRIICRGRKEFETIAQNIEWFKSLYPDILFDKVVKDISRCSFLVPGSYIYYLDETMFDEHEECFIKAEGECSEGGKAVENAPLGQDLGTYNIYGWPFFKVQKDSSLFDSPQVFAEDDFMSDGKDLRQIAAEWMATHGGMPAVGKRNQTLFELACDMRYICGFDESLMLACMPAILERAEVTSVVRSAKKQPRNSRTPRDFKTIINKTPLKGEKEEDDDEKTVFDYLNEGNKVLAIQALPPVFKEYVSIVPQDFRRAAVVALLPMLGTLGSRLRARYLDGVVQSPSFQCEIEAPMASGKSFVTRIYENVMKDVIAEDEVNRAKEEEYEDKVRAAKNEKTQPKKETFMVRLLGARVSIAKLMDRLAAAHGLHVMTYTDEVANVVDGLKAGAFGDIRALLRNAFDNQRFSQEYKSENSSKKQCRIFYNTLHCGTPAEYRKLYKNVEDGTVTRITFATLPDQAYKKLPVFKELTDRQKKAVDTAVARISGVSVVKGKVQPEHMMELPFLNEWAAKWLEDMRKLAARFDNRSLDTFRRRSAVVGFRAGMIAYYLYGKQDKKTQANTCAFAQLVAEQMVIALLRRYNVSEVSNVVHYQNIWNRLEDEFTVDEVEAVASSIGVSSPARTIVFRWKHNGLLDYDKKTKVYSKRKIQ